MQKKSNIILVIHRKKKMKKNRNEKVMGREKITLGTPLHAHTHAQRL